MPSVDPDPKFMRRALELAAMAGEAGEVPVGAVVTLDDAIVGEGFNRPIATNDPTAHAEIIALRQAAEKLGNYRIPGAILYVTLEPCPMCAGAMVHARIERLVFATRDPRAGSAGTVFNITSASSLNHQIECQRGMLADESADLLRSFFQIRR